MNFVCLPCHTWPPCAKAIGRHHDLSTCHEDSYGGPAIEHIRVDPTENKHPFQILNFK